MIELIKQFFSLAAESFVSLYTIPVFGIFSIWSLTLGIFTVALSIKIMRVVLSSYERKN